MALYEPGPLTQWTAWNANVIPFDTFGIAINFFLNRTPLWTRLARGPVGSPTFYITNEAYRPRQQLLGATPIAIGDTSIIMLDASTYDVGDEIQIENEYLLVTAVTIATNTLTVTRGIGGTAAAGHAASLPVFLISNARTGAEINIGTIERIPVTITQYCQTVQHAYSVGGALQADTNYVSGFGMPIDRQRMLAMQHVVDDFESAIYYGAGVPLAATGTRPSMTGLRNLMVTNKKIGPTNFASYKPNDLVRDTIQACFNGGGNPTVMFVSTDFLGGFATWGHAAMRLEAGANYYGTPINTFQAPFLSGISIVPAPLLQQGTAICVSDSEILVRLKRPMIDKPRGSRGDAVEGDIIMEGAIQLSNEAHHAWVSGITGFAAA